MSPVNSINTNDLLAFQQLLKANPSKYIFTDKIKEQFLKKENDGFFHKFDLLIDGFRRIPETLFTVENEQNPTKIYTILLNDININTEMRFAVLSFLIEVKYLDILNAALCFLKEIKKEEELENIEEYVHISIPILKTEAECQKLCEILEHNNPLLNDKETGRLLLIHLGDKPPHFWAYFVNKGLSLIGEALENPLPEDLIASSLEPVSSNENFEFAIKQIIYALPTEYWDDFIKKLIDHPNIHFNFKKFLDTLNEQWLSIPGDDNKKIKILAKLTKGIWNYRDEALKIQILSMINNHLNHSLDNDIWCKGKGEVLKKVANSSDSLFGLLGFGDHSEILENQVFDIIERERRFINASDITQIATGLILHIRIHFKSSETLQTRVLDLHEKILESDAISNKERECLFQNIASIVFSLKQKTQQLQFFNILEKELASNAISDVVKGDIALILGDQIYKCDSQDLKARILLLVEEHINKTSEIFAWATLSWIAWIIEKSENLNTDNRNKAVKLLEKYCKENPKKSGDAAINRYTDCQKAIATVNTSRTSDTITSSTVNTSTPFSKNENISFFRKTLLQVSTALQNTWKWFLKRLPSAFRVHIF